VSDGHTPGPWRAVNRGTGWEIHHFSDATLPGCWCGTADCHGKLPEGMRTDFDREADARLAAAAPELLAALQDVMSWIRNWSPSFTEDDEWSQAEVAANAAIAKATTLTPLVAP
jgi:hypothetical protein